jgi:hypothetical protein
MQSNSNPREKKCKIQSTSVKKIPSEESLTIMVTVLLHGLSSDSDGECEHFCRHF